MGQPWVIHADHRMVSRFAAAAILPQIVVAFFEAEAMLLRLRVGALRRAGPAAG